MELGDYVKPSLEQFSTSKKLHLFKVLLGRLCRLSEGRADWLDSCRLSACAEVLQIWFFISTNSSWLVGGLLRKRNQYRQICWYSVVFSRRHCRSRLTSILPWGRALGLSRRICVQVVKAIHRLTRSLQLRPFEPGILFFFPFSLNPCIHFGSKEDSTQWCVFHLCYQRPHGPRR